MGFLQRRILGKKARGCKIDPVTRQSVVTAKHTGDIEYDLQGSNTVAKESEFKPLSRELLVNPSIEPNLNEIGENSNFIKRKKGVRCVTLNEN